MYTGMLPYLTVAMETVFRVRKYIPVESKGGI